MARFFASIVSTGKGPPKTEFATHPGVHRIWVKIFTTKMDNLDKVRDNVSAAVNKTKLTRAEQEALWKYADATRSSTCDGCDHLCGAEVAGPVEIAATLRYLMYHDSYGKQDRARELFRELPAEARSFSHLDFSQASAACPHGVNLVRLMKRAADVLA